MAPRYGSLNRGDMGGNKEPREHQESKKHRLVASAQNVTERSSGWLDVGRSR